MPRGDIGYGRFRRRDGKDRAGELLLAVVSPELRLILRILYEHIDKVVGAVFGSALDDYRLRVYSMPRFRESLYRGGVVLPVKIIDLYAGYRIRKVKAGVIDVPHIGGLVLKVVGIVAEVDRDLYLILIAFVALFEVIFLVISLSLRINAILTVD